MDLKKLKQRNTYPSMRTEQDELALPNEGRVARVRDGRRAESIYDLWMRT
jgi:hypothetical protein